MLPPVPSSPQSMQAADVQAKADGSGEKTDYDKFIEDMKLCRYIIVGFGFIVTMVCNCLTLHPMGGTRSIFYKTFSIL